MLSANGLLTESEMNKSEQRGVRTVMQHLAYGNRQSALQVLDFMIRSALTKRSIAELTALRETI
jgi:hypothetical protein